MATLADLTVRISANTKGVESTLSRAAKRSEKTAKTIRKHGDSAGKGFGRGLVSNIGSSVSRVSSAAGKGMASLATDFSGTVGTMTSSLGRVGPAGIVVFGGLAAAAVNILGTAGTFASGAFVAGMGAGLTAVPLIFAAQNEEVRNVWSATIDHMKNTMREISAPFEPVLKNIAGMVRRTFDQMTPTFARAFESIAPAVQSFAAQLMSAFRQLTPAVQPVMDAFRAILNRLGPKLPGIFSQISSAVTKLAQFVQQNSGQIAGMFASLIELIPNAINWVRNITNAFRGVADVAGPLGGLIKGAWDLIVSVIQFAWPVINPLLGAIGGSMRGLGNVFGAVAAAIKGNWDGVLSHLRGVVNGLVDLANGALGAINGIVDGVNAIPGVSIPDIPQIPHLAKGGTAHANRPHLVGEEGPELFTPGRTGRVTPNNDLGGGSSQGLGGITPRQLQESMESAMMNVVNGGTVQIDARGVTRLVNRENASQRRR